MIFESGVQNPEKRPFSDSRFEGPEKTRKKTASGPRILAPYLKKGLKKGVQNTPKNGQKRCFWPFLGHFLTQF